MRWGHDMLESFVVKLTVVGFVLWVIAMEIALLVITGIGFAMATGIKPNCTRAERWFGVLLLFFGAYLIWVQFYVFSEWNR